MLIVKTDMAQAAIVGQALAQAPVTAARFVRQELSRGGQRVRRRLIKERLSGPPGIRAGKKLRGSLKREVSRKGTPLDRLKLRVFGAGKIWEAHERGAVITGAPYLTITARRSVRVASYGSKATTVRKGQILRVRRVVLKPRLRFIETAQKAMPEMVPHLTRAMVRAIEAAADPKKLAGIRGA